MTLAHTIAEHANGNGGAACIIAQFDLGHIGRETALEALQMHHSAALSVFLGLAYPEHETAAEKRKFVTKYLAELKPVMTKAVKNG